MASTEPAEIKANLLKRRENLLKELVALDSLITLYEGLSEAPDSESSEDTDQLNLYRWPSSRAAQAAEISRTIEAARKLILNERRPMKRGELVAALEKKGHTFPGKDKNKVFGTNIWRSGRFRTVGNKGYWPKDVPYREND